MKENPALSTNLPALTDDLNVGLEDFDPTTDAVMPTIKIDHDKGVFVDGLSNQEFDELRGVLLGLIKQRVLWEPDVDESKKGPLCRSYDFNVGHPDLARFPWKSVTEVFTAPAADTEGHTLPCIDCPLKEWGSHPNRDTPWCSEQHTFALLQDVGNGTLSPCLLTVQRSAIKSSRAYLTAFAKSKTPLFTVYTTISLDHRKRGTVDYAVPKFSRGEATDTEHFGFFADTYRQIRTMIQTPRSFSDDEDVDEAAATEAAAPTAAAAQPAASAAQPASATQAPATATAAPPDDDPDDLPF